MTALVTVLFRRKLMTVAVFTAVLAAGCALTLLSPRKYESRMKIFIKHDRADSVVSPDSSNAVVRGEVSESDVNTEIELLTNSELLRRVVVRTGLATDVLNASGGVAIQHGESVERAVRKLVKNLSITPVRKASIIQVVYSSDNAEQSAAVLSTLADVYLQDHLRVHRTAGATEFFGSQADRYNERLAKAQSHLSEFRRRNNVVLLPEQKDLLLRRVMETEQALNEATTGFREASERVATLQTKLTGIEARVVTQSRVIPNQYSVERLHTMLTELQNRRTTLLTKFRSDDRLVQEIDKQLADTTVAMARARELTAVEETSDVNPLRQKLESELADAELTRSGLESRRASLVATLSTWRSRLAALDGASTEHDALNREIRQTEDSLLLYSKKKEEARIADSLDQKKIANVSIAEAPARPYLPSKPNVALNIGLSILLACLTSLGTAFALERNGSTFDTAEELQSALGMPVLACVPVEEGA